MTLMNATDIIIRATTDKDFEAIMEVEREAFGEEDEAKLTADLLNDPTAEPVVSLLAWYKNRAVGHIIFTRVYLNEQDSLLMHILAPLAVIPEFQKRGIGEMLIRKGIGELKKLGSDLVFVLGHWKNWHWHRPAATWTSAGC